MSLSQDDVKKIAHLARLALPEHQIDSLKKDLDNILNFAEKMNSVDTQSIEPLAHPLDETQPLRSDQVTEIDQRDIFLKNAPKTTAGLYIVPQFVETE